MACLQVPRFQHQTSLFPRLPRASGPRSRRPPGCLAGASKAASAGARPRAFLPRGPAPRGNTGSANHHLNREGRARRRSRQRLPCQPMRSGGRVGVCAHWVALAPPLGQCKPSQATEVSAAESPSPAFVRGQLVTGFLLAPFCLVLPGLFRARRRPFPSFIFLALFLSPSFAAQHAEKRRLRTWFPACLPAFRHAGHPCGPGTRAVELACGGGPHLHVHHVQAGGSRQALGF